MRGLLLCLLVALSVAFAPAQGSALEVSVGYAGDAGKTVFADEVAVVAVADFEYAPVQSLYLGFGLPVNVQDTFQFKLSGGITVPVTVKAEELFPEQLFFGIPRHNADWSADTIWGTLEGLLSFPIDSTFSVICGFRWDHWQTSFKNPSNISIFSAHTGSDTAALTINGYLPLIGIVSTIGGFTFGAMGFPVALGDVQVDSSQNTFGPLLISESGSFDKGYFFEAFTEVELPRGVFVENGIDCSASLFAKFNAYEARDTIKATASGFVVGSGETDFSFHRNLFVVGGKASINFWLPSFGNML